MSFAAEPYGVFVDDLLTGLTGGVARESFVYLPEDNPFRLVAPGPIRPGTVRVHGLKDNSFRQFQRTVDFEVDGAGTLTWLAGRAVRPDEGTRFYINYEHRGPSGAAPILSDRNPGSVTRLLAESFAREFAVHSGQLEAIYLGAFLETATGRDLDNIALLVGVVRRDPSFATGSVIFSRAQPAKGDISVPAGTKLSTSDAPAANFETTEDRTLRRGSLTIEAPVQAVQSGSAGVVPAGTITVINRPILGITAAENPQATRFAKGKESDAALRERVRRALQHAGHASTGALKGALTRVAGLREKDILISEDPALRPGVVQLDVALPELSETERDAAIRQALDLIEEVRPVGVRIQTNIDAPSAAGIAVPGPNPVPDEGDTPLVSGDVTEDLFMPVDITAVVTPQALGLTNEERETLRAGADAVVREFVAEAGIGEALIYNRLVAQLMALDGVLDVAVQMRAQSEDTTLPGRKNLIPRVAAARPTAGVIDVVLGGALIMMDVTATITLKDAGLLGDADNNRQIALAAIEAELKAAVAGFAGTLMTEEILIGLISDSTDTYKVEKLSYLIEYQDEGVRVNKRDVDLPLSGLEQLWIRTVSLSQSGGAA